MSILYKKQPPVPKILILTVGLMLSGKSEWAMAQGHPVVSPDAIRTAMVGTYFSKKMEGLIWFNVRMMVEALFEAGHHTVIVDSPNTLRKLREKWISEDWDLQYKVFPPNLTSALERAHAYGLSELQDMLPRMFQHFQEPTDREGATLL